MATPQRFQMWCCFKAFSPCRPWDFSINISLRILILPLSLPRHSHLPLMLPTHFENTKWKPHWLRCSERRLALWPNQVEYWATGTNFWTSSNVPIWCLIYFCPRLRSVLSFSRSFYAPLIKASWCSLNTWICSSCKLTYFVICGWDCFLRGHGKRQGPQVMRSIEGLSFKLKYWAQKAYMFILQGDNLV